MAMHRVEQSGCDEKVGRTVSSFGESMVGRISFEKKRGSSKRMSPELFLKGDAQLRVT